MTTTTTVLVERFDVALAKGIDLVGDNMPWMTWNLFLALIPLALAFTLFRPGVPRTALWWMGVLAFVAFLPNAPYVLTDIIHFVSDVRDTRSDSVIVFILMPHYTSFMLAGLAAYVAAIMRVRSYLAAEGLAQWSWPTEVALHALASVGIYLGRFVRFNSWDVLTQPDAVVRTVGDSLARRFPVLVIVVTFLVLVAVAPVLRWIVTLTSEAVRARSRSVGPPPNPAV